MTAAGCPARDHDGNTATPNQASCIGYELLTDLTIGGHMITGTYTALFVGNGFRVHNFRRDPIESAPIQKLGWTGQIEGLGSVNPRSLDANFGVDGGIVSRLEGKIIGSYVWGGRIEGGTSGGMVARVATHATRGFGMVAHSYVVGMNVGNNYEHEFGGIAGEWEHIRGTNRSTCLNSWFSGTITVSPGFRGGLIGGESQQNSARFINCVGDSTTDSEWAVGNVNIAGLTATKAAMTSAVSYDLPEIGNPFANWDDYAADGIPLEDAEPRTDFWFFGDSNSFPVLKAWGHDYTPELARPASGATTVNLCTRTLAVANEIIRHLKDDVRRSGVTTTPAAVTALTPCASSEDTQNVSITNLVDQVVTNASHVFNLSPDRTFPASDRLTSLHVDDFAYLSNVSHIDLGGNDIETLPPQVFQHLPLRWLDLSNNKLTTLPADLFTRLGRVSATTGNALMLNGNSITTTGIPDRIFDTMTHLNGLDLSDNAITGVNTRWFEALNNLGRKAATTPPYTHALGLHLEGNTITEHYYTNKLFTGVKEQVVSYLDTTSGSPPTTTTAGDALRTAIVAAITAANTSVANLDLTTTDYWYNTSSPAAYQASSVTSCTSTQSVGPGRYAYLNGVLPDCQVQPHWSPPHKSADTAATAPTITATGGRGSVTVGFTHATSASFVAYQLRFRPSAIDPWTPWMVVPITAAAGAKSVNVTTLESGSAHSVELRVLTTTGPPSAAVTASATTTAADWLSGYDAATSTTQIGGIALSWNLVASSSLPMNHSVTAFYYRYKLQSAARYNAWRAVPDGSDSDALLNNETSYVLAGLTQGQMYDIQMVAGIDDEDADTTLDYFTDRKTDSATPLTVPDNLRAGTPTVPGTIVLAWNMQTLATGAQAKFQVRRKRRGVLDWSAATWTDVPDSTGSGGDAGTDAHDETGFTLTGLTAGTRYDVQVRLYWDDTSGAQPHRQLTATAHQAAAPAGLSATAGTDPGEIDLSWTAQSATTDSSAGYEMRHRIVGQEWPRAGGWSAISGSTHSTNSHNFHARNNSNIEVEVRFNWNGPGLASSATVTTVAVAAISSFNATAAPAEAQLAWPQQTATTDAAAQYQVRYKLTSASWPTTRAEGWIDVSNSNHATESALITSLTPGSTYNFELRFHWSDAVGTSPVVATTVTPLALPAITGLSGSTSLWQGSIDLTWDRQTATTSPNARLQVRTRLKQPTLGNWTGWSDVPDSADMGTHRYDERSYRAPGLRYRRPYDIGLRLAVGDTPGPVATITDITSGYQPRNFRVVTGTIPRTVVLSWDEQTQFTGGGFVRFIPACKKSADSTWLAWQEIGDQDGDGVRHDETGFTWGVGTMADVPLEPGVNYDCRIMFNPDPNAHSWPFSDIAVFPQVSNVRAAIVEPPKNVTASASIATVNAIDLSWDTQTESTVAASRFQYRIKATATADWTGVSWVNIGDGPDDSSNTYDENNLTITEITSGTALAASTSYDVELRFDWNADMHGTSTAVSRTVTSSGIPAPPNFTAESGAAQNTVDLAWDLVTGAANYQYRYKLTSASSWGSWTAVTDQDGDTMVDDEDAFTVTGLTAGSAYDFELRARTSSANGAAATATATAQVLAAPTGLTATQGTNPGEITLGWTAPTGGTQDGFEYRYKTTSGGPTTWSSWANVPDSGTDGRSDETAYTVVSLWGGESYDLQVRAETTAPLYSVPNSDTTATATAGPVSAPAGFTAAPGSNEGELNLTWTAIPSSGLPTNDTVVNYQYSTKLSSATEYDAWIDIPSGNTDAYTIIGLQPGSPYDLRLRAAIDDGGDLDTTLANYHSSVATQTGIRPTIASPTGLSAATGSDPGEVNLAWTAQTDYDSTSAPDAKYQVRAKLTADDWPSMSPYGWQDATGTDDSSASYVFENLTNRQLHDIQLRFVPQTGLISVTASTQGTPAAVPTPSGFSASTHTTSLNALALTWTAQSDTTNSQAKYQVRRKLASDTWPTMAPYGWTDVADSGSDGAHNEAGTTLTGLTSGGSYNVELRFHWSDGVGASAAAAQTATASAVPAPAGLMTAVDYNEVKIDWTAQTASSSSEAKYQVRYKKTTETWPGTTPFGWADISGSGASTATATVTGLEGGSAYNFELRFHYDDTTGVSPATAVTATPTAIPVPTGVTATTSATVRQIEVSWDAQTAITDSDAKFQTRLTPKDPDAIPSDLGWTDVPDSDSDMDQHDESSATRTGLQRNRPYDVEVRMVIGTAVGPASAIIPDVRAGYYPRNLTATAGDVPGTIDVKWDQQTQYTNPLTRFVVRHKVTGAPGGHSAWTYLGTVGDHHLTSHTITGLTLGEEYDVQVKFRDTVWPPDAYTPTVTNVEAAVVLPPKNLVATSPSASAGAVTLTWDEQMESTVATSFFEYRYKPSSTAAWTGITYTTVLDPEGGTTLYDETTAALTGLTPATSYDFQVRFYWSSGHGRSVNAEVTQTTSAIPAPADFTASSGTAPGNIDLSWDAIPGASDYQYRYRLTTPANSPFGSWTDVATATNPSVTISSGLTAGTSYTFEVRARVTVNSATTNGPTATDDAVAQTQPGPQTFTVAAGTNPGSLNLSWTAPASGTPTRYEYRHKLASEAASAYSTWAQVPDQDDPQDGQGDETSYTVTGLKAGVSYNVQLHVISNAGTSQPVTRTQTPTPVAAPASFTATIGDGPGEIDLSWTAIAASGLPSMDTLVQYQYRTRHTFGGGANIAWTAWTNIPASSTSSHTITGLSTYIRHNIELRAAIDDNDDADALADYYSNVASLNQIYSGLARPANLRVAGGTNPGEVDLTWNAQTAITTGFSSAKYEFRAKLASGSWPAASPFGWQDVPSSGLTTATHTVEDLMNGQLHDIEVRFVPSSTLMSAASTIQGTPTIVPTPTSFSAATATAAAGALDLTWNAQSAETGTEAKYQYRRKLASDPWPASSPFGWTDIADSGTDGAHNESSLTVSGLTSGQSYNVQLRFHWSDDIGPSAAVSSTATASAVPTPGSFTAGGGTAPGTIDISWAVVTGAIRYEHRHKAVADASYGNWMPVADSNSDGDQGDETSATITGLTGNSRYNVQIRAVVTGGSTSTPATQTATATLQPPPATFTLSAGTAAGSIVMAWTAPTSGTVTKYQRRHKLTSAGVSGWTTWEDIGDGPDSGTSASDEVGFTITGLWGGVSYDVELVVEGGAGTSQARTATRVATAVAAPTGFSAAAGSNPDPGAIGLSWTALAANTMPSGHSVVQYQYRTKLSSASASAYTSWTNIPAANTASYTITLASTYTQYDIQLRAAIDDGDADALTDYYSSAASVTSIRSGLARPANLRVAGGTNPGEISLTWNVQTEFGSAFTAAKYEVRAKLTSASWPSGGGWGDVASSTRTTAAHTLTGLMAAQQYDIELRFVPDTSLTSAATSIQGTPTAVATPSSFSATTSRDAAGSINLSWTAQSATSGSEAKYQYRAKLTSATWPGTTPFGWTDIADSGSDGAHNESSLALTGLTAGGAYNLELRFHWSDAVGASSAAATTATASTIPTPAMFSASTGSDPGEIDLTWNAVANATYQVRTKLTSAGDSTYSAWSGAISTTTHTVTGLTNAEHYTIQLRAAVTGVSGYSPVATTTAQAQSQPGPRSFAAAAGTNAGEIALSWAAPSSGTVTRYEYRYKLASVTAYPASGTGSWAQIMDSGDSGTLQSDETSFTVPSLLGGLSYNLQLRVLTTAGYSLPATATRTATPVAAPTNFNAARGSGPGEIDLTWTAITTGMPSGDSVVQYQFRRKLNSATWPTSGDLGWTNIAAANTSSFTITGLTPYALYDVQLRAAIDDGGDADSVADYHSSAASQGGIRSGLPNPSNVRATGGTTPGSLNLTWTGNSVYTQFISGTFQYRTKLASAAASAFTSWTSVSTIGPSVTSHTITDLMNGQLHDIQLRYRPTTQLFSNGAAIQGTPTALAVPTNVRAVSAPVNVGAIEVRWNAQSAITVSTAEFQVRTKLPSTAWTGVAWTAVPDSTAATDPDTDRHDETMHIVTGLSADVRYDVQVRFFMSTAIGGSTPVTVSANASSVPVPTGFDATTGSGAGEINLSWTAITGATGYDYRYKRASDSSYPATGTGSWTDVGNVTSTTIENLSGGVFYDIQIRAKVTGIGESAPTSAERAQAQTTPGPATLTFEHGPNPGDIKIDWTRPTPPAPAEHYEYRYKRETASDSAYSAWEEVMDSGDSGTAQDDETTVTIAGLQAGKSYHIQFRVYASQAIGYSLPQRGTQASRPVPPPTSFTATGGTNPGEVDLAWTASAGVTILRYEVRHRLDPDGAWSGWANSGTTTTHSYTGLRAGMQRTFQVRAVMETVGESASVDVTGTPTPVPTPGSFTASTGTFPGEIDLSWLPVTGSTSYQYRYKLENIATWPDDAEWESVSAALTATTLETLDEGARYDIELRAAITNVGESMAAMADAASRSATFTDEPTTPTISAAYSVSAAEVPGRIAIKLPGSGETFVHRHRTANPGEWSRWYKVTPGASDAQYLIPDLIPGVRYEIQVRAYTGMTTGFTTALVQTAQAAPLVAAENFKAGESSGIILLEWSSPALYTPDSYEYRTRPTGTTTWSAWVTVQHEGDRGSTQRHWIVGLETGISHDFELRMQTQAGPSPIASSAGSARLRIAEVDSIRPVVRSVTVRAGDSIALTVDIYDTQQGLDNSIPGKDGSKLRFRWSEQGPAGGGTFADPANTRRVTYTAPSTPGVYTVQAEAQPDGICTSHHEGAAEITTEERAQCTAIFTVRVSAIPAETAPRPDPVNPTGTIPTTLTDNEGVSYAVFTPADGGTFTGTDITVTAPAAAVPDRTVVGIAATVSDIRPDDPIPGATMTVAGSYYNIRALAAAGDPPLPAFNLNEPATACLPFPQEFRADLSNVVVVQRQPTGELSILSTTIRSQAGELTTCATLTKLPATVAVARLGLVPTAPAPAPTATTPDTGALAPSYTLVLLTLFVGLLLLTRIRRIS